jgi:hypothetical protein
MVQNIKGADLGLAILIFYKKTGLVMNKGAPCHKPLGMDQKKIRFENNYQYYKVFMRRGGIGVPTPGSAPS